jgi:hypothetical protein
VAISSCCKEFINTNCFKQVLNRIWYNKLSPTESSFFRVLGFSLSVLTLGLLAPCVVPYCHAEGVQQDKMPENYHSDIHQVGISRIYAFLKAIML